MIIGSFGFQRSGKTALTMFIARYFSANFGCKIYSNIEAENVILIEKISDIPIDGKPKILILDEAYIMLDSRNFANNKEFTLFLNTLGKQKILMCITAISPDTVDKRLRDQMSFIFLARGDATNMHYVVYDVLSDRISPVFSLEKTADLWSYLAYNSNLVVPNYVEPDIKTFTQNAKQLSTNY
jgi:hypothetical protein